jgi:hypothetical protein
MPWKYNGSEVATNKGFRRTDGYMTPKNWNAVWDNTEKANQGLTWEDPASETVSDADKLAALRTLRDMKLQETDFYALSDVTLADNMKTYRQNLRDITDSYQSLDADGFAWPTKPS